MSASFIAPLVAGFILKNDVCKFLHIVLVYIQDVPLFYFIFFKFMLQTTLEQWRKVFGISSVVAVVTYVMYQVFGTSEVQSWNYSRNITSQETEHEPLKRDKSSPGTDVTDVQLFQSFFINADQCGPFIILDQISLYISIQYYMYVLFFFVFF